MSGEWTRTYYIQMNPLIRSRMHQIAIANRYKREVYLSAPWFALFFNQIPMHWRFCRADLDRPNFYFRGIDFILKE